MTQKIAKRYVYVNCTRITYARACWGFLFIRRAEQRRSQRALQRFDGRHTSRVKKKTIFFFVTVHKEKS